MLSKEELLEKLENDLKIRRYSSQTLKRYLYITDMFLKYEEEKNKDLNKLNEYDAIEFLNYLTVERKYKSSSYNNVNAIVKFFLEVVLERNIGYKRLPNAKLEVKLKYVPTKKEILYLIDNAKSIKQKCFISLAYGSGLRVSEIARLEFKSIDSKNMKIKVIGKGKKERLTLLSKKTLEYLIEYVNEYKITKKDKYIFKGQKGEYITESTISRGFKDLVKKLKMNENITIHTLRRSFATHLLRMGVDIYIVKELMGHNSITTTSGYAQVLYKEKQIKNPLDSEF